MGRPWGAGLLADWTRVGTDEVQNNVLGGNDSPVERVLYSAFKARSRRRHVSDREREREMGLDCNSARIVREGAAVFL